MSPPTERTGPPATEDRPGNTANILGPTVSEIGDIPAYPDCACRIRECDVPDPATCGVHGELHAMICLDPGWQERARARAAAADARRQATKELRADLKAARDAGKQIRHARRLTGGAGDR